MAVSASTTGYDNQHLRASGARDIGFAGRTKRLLEDGLSMFDGAQLDQRIG
jgi:hypothetical protein